MSPKTANVKKAFKTSVESEFWHRGERQVKVITPGTEALENPPGIGGVMNVRAHVLISGRVQGVFFRSEAELQARRLDVTGWVRNLADGRVEAVFEGQEANVKQLIEFCRTGPRGARVTDVNVVWEVYKNEFRRFEVRGGLDF